MSDLISRCELFNKLAPVQTLGEAYGIIQEMPTVDAVPVRHGQWERHYCKDDGLPDGWQCSACSEWYFFDNKPNFCTNCGADMRKDGDYGKAD